MCLLPAASSSLRVSVSEYFGSAVSITMKKRSWLASAKRRCFNNGWCSRGSRFKNNMPNSAPNAPSKIVSSYDGGNAPKGLNIGLPPTRIR